MEKYINLERRFIANNFKFTSIHDKSELIPLLEKLVPEKSIVSVGGSETLFQTGVIDLLRSGRYTFYDRYAEGADMDEVFRKSFFADYYFASANALTEHGEVYMVDGYGNRIAATIYGPKNVILVCGKNKIVKNLAEAVYRAHTIATPLNGRRIHKDTYCTEHGQCYGAECDPEHLMCSWRCGNAMCANAVILSKQTRVLTGRIHIILIDEDYGY